MIGVLMIIVIVITNIVSYRFGVITGIDRNLGDIDEFVMETIKRKKAIKIKY